MKIALKEAEQAARLGEIPVGAVVVDYRTDTILARAHNETEQGFDVSAHAEIVALRRASNLVQSARLPFCDLYVTLEPCAMCAAAISFARIRRLYFGAYDEKGGGVLFGAKFYQQPTCHHKPEFYGGIAQESCSKLLIDFFKERRKK